MMRWIIGWSVGLRFLILVLAGALMVYGITQIRAMPVDVFPEFDPPLVEVQTEALGLSAAEMEALITVPLEADLLNGVAWLDQIYSESVVGLSSILLVFEPGTDPIRARQMVQERLTQTFALPNVSKPPTMLQPLSTTSRVMMVGLSSDDLSLTDLGVLARWNIKPRLMGVPGVANVAVWGQRERQLQVQVDPEQLRDYGVTLQQVIETTGEALWVSPLSYLESSKPGTAGWIDTPNQRISLRHELPISSAEDLARVPVKGTAWILGDVAQVVEDHQPLIGDSILSDGPGLLMVIEKFPNANTREVTRGVEQALDAMRPGLSGVEIDETIFSSSNYIDLAVSSLSTALLIGALFAVIVLWIFTFEWRGVLISAVSVAASLFFTLFIIYMQGSTFNIMVLAGLVVALGVIVDDSVIAAENAIRRLRQSTGDEEPWAVLKEALLEMRSPIGFATLIIVLTAVPIYFLEGLTGTFFQPLVTSYITAVIVSFAAALIITPALSAVFLNSSALRRDISPVVGRLQSSYERLLNRSLYASVPALVILAVAILLTISIMPFLETSLLPDLQYRDLRIQWEGVPGTSRAAMERVMTQVSEELRQIPGVQNVATHIGRAITGDEIVGINSGEIWVNIDEESDRETVAAAASEVIRGYPGVFREAEPYLPERLDEALAGPEEDLLIRIYGHEFDVLRGKAEQVKGALSAVDGLHEVEIEPISVEPQVEIQPDLTAAERFQVKPGDVRRAATTLLSGLQVGNLYEEQKVFDVVVWGAPEIRANLTDVQELLIDTPRGGHVTLGEVAEIRIAPAPVVIRRDAVSRFIDVSASVSGRSLTSVASDIENALAEIDFPLEYHAELISRSAERQAAQQRVILAGLIALVGIVLVLHAAFGIWRLAFVVSLILPAALLGSVLAIVLAGGVLSFGSIFGLFAVAAIAVRNAMVMIRHFQDLELEQGAVFGPELVVRGAKERLAPMLMTAFVVGVALLPIAMAGSRAGTEIVQPMSLVVLGGLVSTTLLSMFVLPILYLRYGTTMITEEARRSVGTQTAASLSSD